MNKLNLYVVRDTVAGDNTLILSAKNDGMLKRNVKGFLMLQQQNYLNTDTADKQIYQVGVLDTDSGIIEAFAQPSFVVSVEELRNELVAEIRSKQEVLKEDDGANSVSTESND